MSECEQSEMMAMQMSCQGELSPPNLGSPPNRLGRRESLEPGQQSSGRSNRQIVSAQTGNDSIQLPVCELLQNLRAKKTHARHATMMVTLSSFHCDFKARITQTRLNLRIRKPGFPQPSFTSLHTHC